MIDKQQLKQMSTWSGFVGIMTIIGGAISCISIVGIIPGIISIILGLKLRSAKKVSDELIASQEESVPAEKINVLVSELSIYFKIQGILIIIGLVLSVIGIFLAFGMGLWAASQFNYYY